MIRNTHAAHPDGMLVAYNDNAAVIEGRPPTASIRGGRRATARTREDTAS